MASGVQTEFVDWLTGGAIRHSILDGPGRAAFGSLFDAPLRPPRFLLLLEPLGLLAVDVKEHAQRAREWNGSRKGATLKIGAEIRDALAFERVCRIPCWYAFGDREGGAPVWHWIRALRALEVGKVRTTERTGGFLSVQPEHLERIARPTELTRLYAPGGAALEPQRHRIARAPVERAAWPPAPRAARSRAER